MNTNSLIEELAYVDDHTKRRLIEDGWATVDLADSNVCLLEFARKLGKPTPSRQGGLYVDRLVPTSSEKAHPRSMSAVFGEGSFPFHTDAAYLRIPPRFVLLRLAEGDGVSRPTLLLDSGKLQLSLDAESTLRRDVWLVNGGRGRFYTPLLNDTLLPGMTVMRFDPCCMRPLEGEMSSSLTMFEEAMDSTEPQYFTWERNRVVIIDNWRVLHARGAKPNDGTESRVLERVLVNTG